MKGIFLAIIVTFLFLTGCSKDPIIKEEKEEVKKTENVEETLATPSESKEAESEKPSALSAYYDIVVEMIEPHGILTEDNGENQGLAYANLIDFNGDDLPELYMISAQITDEFHYKEEVWTYKNDKAAEIFSKQYKNEGRSGDISSRSIATVDSKSYLVDTGGYSAGSRGNDPSISEYLQRHIFLSLEGTAFVEKDNVMAIEQYYEDSDKPRMIYEQRKNDTVDEITAKEYKTILKKYNSDSSLMLILDDTGSKSLNFAVSNNKETIKTFLRSLDPGKFPKLSDGISSSLEKPMKNIYDDLTTDEKRDLIEYLYQFSNSRNINVKKDDGTQVIEAIANGLYYQSFIDVSIDSLEDQSIIDDSFSYVAYPADRISELAEKLFGTAVERKDYGLYAKYKDEIFYLLDEGTNRGASSPQVEKFISIGDDLYYAQFTIYEFEFNEKDPEELNYLAPKEVWTDAEFTDSYESEKGYAILKEAEQDGEKTWHLVIFDRNGEVLNSKELESF
ncbi:hypothetical protein QYG89_16435 [Bacillus sp. B190/17]|uniref:DUF5105 domain-containing protein n=1 Tax=Bacillus lumedeiriae TaxID=3058829 RepID=A0ABW8IEV8_9BACI